MKPIEPAGFEDLFRRNNDPWNYAQSPFEAFKRRALIRAAGTRWYGRGLELACANGETSRVLLSRCRRLLAVDSSTTVIHEARRRVPSDRVTFAVSLLPQQTPAGPFDLIVASELLYYLPALKMGLLLRQMRSAVGHGGRIVLVHHTISFQDAAQAPRLAHARAKRFFGKSMRPAVSAQHARFEVVAFDVPKRRRIKCGQPKAIALPAMAVRRSG